MIKPLRLLSLAAAILAAALAASAEVLPIEPDFAFPKQTEAQADSLLKVASKTPGLDGDMLRAEAMLITIRTAMDVDPKEALLTMPAKVARMKADMKTNAGLTLLNLLEAQTYNDAYLTRQIQYDKVQTPLHPYPKDLSEWSGEQYRTCIDSLLTLTLDKAVRTAWETSLDEMKAAIDPGNIACLNTLGAFVALKVQMLAHRTELKDAARRKAIEWCPKESAQWFFWQCLGYTDNDERPLYRPRNEFDLTSTLTNTEICQLYHSHLNSPHSVIALLSIADRDSIPIPERVAMIKQYLKRYPDNSYNTRLNNELAELTKPQVNIQAHNLCAPGMPFDVHISHDYTQSVGLAVYTLKKNKYNNYSLDKLVQIKNFDTNPELYKADTTVMLTIDKPGIYGLCPVVNGDERKSRYDHIELTCTDVLPIFYNATNPQAIVTVNSTDGSPCPGIEITSQNKTLGTTDSQGTLITRLSSDCKIELHRNGTKLPGIDTYNIWPGRDYSPRNQIQGIVITDLPVYKPGQTVQWAVVAYSNDEVKVDLPLQVEIRDANYQVINTIDATTDSWGRIEGSTTLPDDCLTGNFTISAQRTYKGKEKKYAPQRIATSSFMVSDYRMPTFKADFTDVERLTDGAVTLRGSAFTYTGMPVADANVAIAIQGARRWRWFAPELMITRLETTTDASGAFTVTILADELLNSGYVNFIARATVTSKANEAADATRNFTIGKPYVIDIKGNIRDINIDNPLSNPFTVYDATGREQAIDLNWQLINANKAIAARGTIVASAKATLDFGTIAAGDYTLRVEPADSTLAEPAENKVLIYSLERNAVPKVDGLFIPGSHNITLTEGNTAEIIVGCTEPTYLFTARCCALSLMGPDCTLLEPGFTTLTLEMPADQQMMNVKLVCVRNCQTYQYEITIRRPDPRRVTLQGQAMRDQARPGTPETWRLTLLDADSQPLQAAMIATMFNAPLNDIFTMHWPSSIYSQRIYPQLYVDMMRGYLSETSISITPEIIRTDYPDFPLFRFIQGVYPVSDYIAYAYMASGSSMNKMASYSRAMPDMDIEEEAEEVAEDAAVADTGASSDLSDPSDPSSDIFRDPSLTLALWQPGLVSSPDGTIELCFTLPQAVTTWDFRAFAWTHDKRAASLQHSLIASKPVMVQATVPRFLRTGDEAQISATVFNNTDSAFTAHVLIEVYNGGDGRTLQAVTIPATVDARASAVVTAPLSASAQYAILGVRVKATAQNFTDGEQTLVPVIESAATVVESHTFYLDAADPTYQATIDIAPDMNVTLQYCQNPVWSAVRAMQGVEAGSVTSLGTANELFTAQMAQVISRRSPRMVEALCKWSHDASATESPLMKNDDIKLTTLSLTPWVQTAASQSERALLVAQLFDPTALTRRIADLQTTLSKYSNRDGGFRWGKWDGPSSIWATERVLMASALAHSLGARRSDKLDNMLNEAFDWYQDELKDKKTCTMLALISALDPTLRLTAKSRQIINATVSSIAKDWRKHSTSDKAFDALILNANGREADARLIVKSLQEYAVSDPRLGITFPSVTDIRSYATIIQAFANITPNVPELEGMRRWVVMQQQANSDFFAANPDYVIAALLLTGQDWTLPQAPAEIKVDGQAIPQSDSETLTGYLSRPIDAPAGSVTIDVVPPTRTPSYGSVTAIGRRPIAQIQALDSPDLRIDKHLLVLRDGQWTQPDTIRAGERVQVLITLHALRNMEYVTLIDPHAAALDPVEQLPGSVAIGGLWAYREPRDTETRIYISHLPQGTYQLSYDATAMFAGTFCSGPATIQSQYAPELTARSAGHIINIAP